MHASQVLCDYCCTLASTIGQFYPSRMPDKKFSLSPNVKRNLAWSRGYLVPPIHINVFVHSPCSPSFICKWTESNKAIAIKQNIAKLLDIRTTIHKCNNALYSASAGANPGDMNQAMTQISKQVPVTLVHIVPAVFRLGQPLLTT